MVNDPSFLVPTCSNTRTRWQKKLLWNKARRTPRQVSINPFRVANEAYISNELLVVSWVVKQHAQQSEITVLCRDMLGPTRPNQGCGKTLIRHGSPKNSNQTFCYWCRNINVLKWIKRVGWNFWWRLTAVYVLMCCECCRFHSKRWSWFFATCMFIMFNRAADIQTSLSLDSNQTSTGLKGWILQRPHLNASSPFAPFWNIRKNQTGFGRC